MNHVLVDVCMNQEMIGKFKMLNDKHIEQWAEYLLEEIPNGMDIMKTTPELWGAMIKMYKKGYEDCLHEHGIKSGD